MKTFPQQFNFQLWNLCPGFSHPENWVSFRVPWPIFRGELLVSGSVPPIGSMYGIFTHISWIFMVKVDIPVLWILWESNCLAKSASCFSAPRTCWKGCFFSPDVSWFSSMLMTDDIWLIWLLSFTRSVSNGWFVDCSWMDLEVRI